MNVLGLLGSLRADSLNRKLLNNASTVLADRGASVMTFDIGTLPHFNEDVERSGPPTEVSALYEALNGADALLVVTPEYNTGIPGVMKNAIDWASRPAFKSPLVGKPTGILTASPGSLGGTRCQAQLRTVLFGTLTPVYTAPEFLLGGAFNAFDDAGQLSDEKTAARLQRYLEGFLQWAEGVSS